MGLKKATSKKVVPMYTIEDFNQMGQEYADLSSQIKSLEERKKNLADLIKEGAEQLGVKDDKGSFYLDSTGFILGKVASKSMKIDQEKAVKYLKGKKLKDCIKTVTLETVDEDKLEQAVVANKITLDEVQDFTTINVAYKVSVVAKEEVPEIQQSKVSVAKRKK